MTTTVEREVKLRFDSVEAARAAVLATGATPLLCRRLQEDSLLDTDDAMRLVEMRGWLAGHGWFDLHEARVQPPLGYDTHWSRLIDAGLAGVFMLFKFIDPQSAERLMRMLTAFGQDVDITVHPRRRKSSEGGRITFVAAPL